MRFYYENFCGDNGYFTLKKTEIVKAIQSAWNIEASLWVMNGKIKEPLFFPYEDNDVSNEYLKEYNLFIEDSSNGYRNLCYLDTGKIAIDYDDYSDVLKLN